MREGRGKPKILLFNVMFFSLKYFYFVKILVYSFVKHTEKKEISLLLRNCIYHSFFVKDLPGAERCQCTPATSLTTACLSKLNAQKCSSVFNTLRMYLDFHLHIFSPIHSHVIHLTLTIQRIKLVVARSV